MSDALETLRISVDTIADDARETLEGFKYELNVTIQAVANQPATDCRAGN